MEAFAARRRRRARVHRVRPRARRDTLRPAPAPRAPSAPAAAPATPASPAQPHQLVDDATSAADRAALRFRTENERTRIEQEGAYDRTDFQEALRRMGEQRPKDEQTTRESANRQGLFYSGQLGKQLSELRADYTRREGDAQTEFDRRDAARAAARRALESGMSIDDAAITAQLAERQLGRDADAAAVGALAPPAAAAAPKAGRVHPTRTKDHVAAGLRRTGKNTYVGPNGVVWHRTKNGTFARGRG